MTPPRTRARSRGRRAAAASCLAALSLASGLALGWLWLRRSLPVSSGTLPVAGSAAPIDVLRDREAIAHVFAENEADAYFGLGFVHAQERLWQLELMRRAASGRLAEVFGAAVLDEDRLLRTVGLRRAAEQGVAALAPDERLLIESYVRGINAGIRQTRLLPPEFLLFGVEPEPWSLGDVLADMKLLAWQLAERWRRELSRAELAGRLAPDQISELLGGEPEVLGTQRAWFGALAPAFRALDRLEPARSAALGSNNWALSGVHTASGKPLLANDPHLDLSLPAVWYLAQLSAPGLNVIGATIPGLPGVILGRNDRVAWSFTNNRADTQDLYLERLDPSDATRYATPQGSAPFEIVEERIAVKGGAPQLLSVRVTRHGPVISDADATARQLMPPGLVLALRFAALLPDDASIEFPLRVAHARDVGGVLDAARTFYSPPQNIVAADHSGGLAFVAAGRVPLRSTRGGARGLLPLAGWLGEHDWQGFIPFDELPQSRQPASGVLITANQELTPSDYPHWLGADWAAPDRALRIESLLAQQPRHTLESFAQLQMDERSATARGLIAELLPAPKPLSERSTLFERALSHLQRWDAVMRSGDPEPLIYASWLRVLTRSVFQDELAELWGEVVNEAGERLTERLLDPRSRWCDIVSTPELESCPALAERALTEALDELSRQYGGDLDAWRWGEAHAAHFHATPLGELPLVGRLFDALVPSGGGNDTVNLGEYLIDDPAEPFASRCGPSYRAVYDLGAPESSRFLVGIGQSGNPLSPYYRHWAQRWQQGEGVPMVTQRSRIEAEGAERLQLNPSSSRGDYAK